MGMVPQSMSEQRPHIVALFCVEKHLTMPPPAKASLSEGTDGDDDTEASEYYKDHFLRHACAMQRTVGGTSVALQAMHSHAQKVTNHIA